MNRLWSFCALLSEVGWLDLLDISVVAALLFFGLHRMRTARTRSAGIALMVLGAIFILAGQLELQMTVWLLQGIAAVFILIVVVVFQNEIRRLFENFPLAGRRNRMARPALHDASDVITDAAARLAQSRTGALIVVRGSENLDGTLTGGIPLRGVVSMPLLLSLFDPGSPGHDGAVVLEGDMVSRFGVHLPLSTESGQIGERGTRHAAALGLSERSDALIVVVSEETGRVSVALDGEIYPLTSVHGLARMVRDHLEKTSPGRSGNGRPIARLKRVGLEAGFSGLMSVGLWLALVPGSVVDQASYRVPVTVQNVPDGYLLETVGPQEVEVTLSGPRRYLYFLDPRRLAIRFDATLAAFGRREFAITPNHFVLPPEVEVINVSPEQVQIIVGAVSRPRP